MKTGAHAGIRSFAKTALNAAALGVSSLALTSGTAFAQQFAEYDPEEAVTVVGESAEPASPRYTAPLQDLPQTITVVPRAVIEQQNLLNLRDVLSTLPGITFGAGEGGGGYGDSINLRGFSASNDIGVDGVRDSAQYSRTDPFNLEQVEVTNGANSVYGGAGSVGGSINLVTKRPGANSRTTITGAVGTDDYRRVTVDSNIAADDDVAFRVNLMAHENNVPGRDVEMYERWGIAPSVTFGLGGGTRATVLLTHQEDDNIPQYGVPYALGAFNNGALPGVSNEDYFGYRNIDHQSIALDSASLIIDHDFNADLRLRNLTRWQRVSQLAIVSPPQGTWCVAPGINPWTGAACPAGITAGFYAPQALPLANPLTTGPRGTARDTVNEIVINQTDLTSEFDTGGVHHTLTTGLSVSKETYHLDNANVLRGPLGQVPTLPQMSFTNPDNVYTGPVNFIRSSFSDNQVENAALWVFERAEIGEHWEINGGVRFENNRGTGVTNTIATPYPAPPAQPVVTLGARGNNEDELFSYRIGGVYKPAENLSFYVAYGNSRAPSQSTVNGSCQAVTAQQQNCNLDPEAAINTEIGAKWDVFDRRLALTAAIFRNERTNFRVNSGDPTVPQQQLDGEARVTGVALGAAGLITDDWSVFANYTYLDSEVVQNISDIAIGGGTLDFTAGDPLPNTPKHAFSAWTTYQTPFGVMLGYGATYQGEYTFARASATANLYYTPDYWVHRAMVSYPLTDNLDIQLNVNNLFDEEYFERVRNNATNGWATPGTARAAIVSLEYSF